MSFQAIRLWRIFSVVVPGLASQEARGRPRDEPVALVPERYDRLSRRRLELLDPLVDELI